MQSDREAQPAGGALLRNKEGSIVPWGSPMVLLFRGARGRQGRKEGFLSAPDLYRYLLLWYYTATLYFMLPRTEKRCDKQSSF